MKSCYRLRIQSNEINLSYLSPKTISESTPAYLNRVISIPMLQNWLERTGHQQFTTTSQSRIHQHILEYLIPLLQQIQSLAVYHNRQGILLTDVLDTLESAGQQFYGIQDEMCQIGQDFYHITELITEQTIFSDPKHIELRQASTPEQVYYPPTNLIQNLIKNGYTEEDEETDDTNDEEQDLSSDSDESNPSETRVPTTERPTTTLLEDLQQAQKMLDELLGANTNECEENDTFGDEQAQENSTLTKSNWKKYASESGSEYYELEDLSGEQKNTETFQSFLSRQEFSYLIGVIMSEIQIPIAISPAALTAFQQYFDRYLFLELTEGVLGYQIAKAAIEWRFYTEMEKCQKVSDKYQKLQLEYTTAHEQDTTEKKKLQQQLDEVQKQVRVLQKQLAMADENAPTGLSANAKDPPQKLTRLAKMKRALSDIGTMKKKAKIVPQ